MLCYLVIEISNASSWIRAARATSESHFRYSKIKTSSRESAGRSLQDPPVIKMSIMRSWNVDPFDKTRGCVLYIISTLEDTWRNAFLMNPRVCHLSTLRVHNASLTYNIDVSRPPILLLFIAPSRWDFHFSIFSSTKINVTCYLLSTVDKYSSFFSFIDQLLQARRIRNFSKSLVEVKYHVQEEKERETSFAFTVLLQC